MSTNSPLIMITDSKFSWKKRAKAFVYAWQGMKTLISSEHNARIHLAATIAVIIAGFCFGITAVEWCLILLCIGTVFSAEALNSAVEALADRITTEHDPFIGKAKDFGAAAVTLLALVAVAVGLIVFLPYVIALF